MQKRSTLQRRKQCAARRRAAKQRPASTTADAAKQRLAGGTIQGGPLLGKLSHFVQGLRDESPHANRALFLDDVFITYLLAFFNPTLRSLRTIEDLSQTRQAQKHLSIARICRSTLSDFHKIADPTRLEPLIAELRQSLLRKAATPQLPADLAMLLKQVIAVDGTFFTAAADVAWAVGHRNQTSTTYNARVDVHLDIQTWLPEVIAIPDPGESEPQSAARHIRPGAIHLYDRGYVSFDLLSAHYDVQGDVWTPQAHFVLRTKRNNWNFKVAEEHELSAAALAAQVRSDELGQLPGSSGHHPPRATLRRVVIVLDDGDEMELVTNLLDVPAEIIALLYRYRWQVELFFRWLKCFANFDHLISHSRQGLQLNFYIVIIGVLLMYLHTGYRPSKYAFSLLGLVAQGEPLDVVLRILRERERQCEVARQSAARRRAKKKQA